MGTGRISSVGAKAVAHDSAAAVPRSIAARGTRRLGAPLQSAQDELSRAIALRRRLEQAACATCAALLPLEAWRSDARTAGRSCHVIIIIIIIVVVVVVVDGATIAARPGADESHAARPAAVVAQRGRRAAAAATRLAPHAQSCATHAGHALLSRVQSLREDVGRLRGPDARRTSARGSRQAQRYHSFSSRQSRRLRGFCSSTQSSLQTVRCCCCFLSPSLCLTHILNVDVMCIRLFLIQLLLLLPTPSTTTTITTITIITLLHHHQTTRKRLKPHPTTIKLKFLKPNEPKHQQQIQ
jgi:hypothetical protein